jgi:hypothetical protein
MTNRHENHRRTVDSLLAAGDNGELLRASHLPYLRTARVQVTLPPVLDPGCCHVAEISLSDWRIRYKEVLSRPEAAARHSLSLLPEAKEYISTHWGNSLLRFEPSVIVQTRHGSDRCTWSVFDQGGNMFMETGHRSEFMELARQCVVRYTD